MTQMPIALTLGSPGGEAIHARLRKGACAEVSDFVRIGRTVGRVAAVFDDNDFGSELEVSRRAAHYLESGARPSEETAKRLYKRLVIEPLGTVHPDGSLSEYEGGAGYFEPVYFASGAEIRALYPATRGIRVGYVASGRRTTRIPFHLPETALERHGVIFGKQGSGKTVFLKNLLADNLYGETGQGLQVPALVFGHPDLVLENRSAGTLGLLALEDDRIVTFGYDRAIKLHPQEIALEDVFHQFPEMSPAMRDLWFHVARRSPGDFIGRLARYDVNADPLELVLRTEQVGAPKKPVQRGVAPRSTVNACIRQARILGSQLSASAQPVLSRIALALQERKTVLVNTYNLSDYGAAFFIRLVLTRLTRLGERALHKGRAQRYFVIVDEAQHFLQRAAEEVTEFVRTCRKFGVTLFFATQSPSCIPTSVYGQLYTTVSFHLSKADVRALLEVCPALEDTKHVLLRPPLKNTLGTAAVSALGYPYPCTIRTEPFERVVERIRRLRESLKHEGGTHDGRRTALPAPARG